jgi:hypothetical protein
MPLATTALHHRTAYRQCAAVGGTVHQLGGRAAAAIAEVEALTDEVVTWLEGDRKTDGTERSESSPHGVAARGTPGRAGTSGQG